MSTTENRKSAGYRLHYWQGLPGRGEYVRLAFEATGTPFEDVAFEPGRFDDHVPRPFAPPVLVHGDVLLSQTAVILDYLAPRLGLVVDDPMLRATSSMHQLTIADLVVEAHDAHHPLGPQAYYEEQKAEAKKRARAFIDHRLPKFARHFENILQKGPWLLGDAFSYPDLSLFQTFAGISHAFPNAYGRLAPELPALEAHRARVAALPKIAAYLASDRRRPFNDSGLFRHYPALDES
jgi:glutathione S-transferase